MRGFLGGFALLLRPGLAFLLAFAFALDSLTARFRVVLLQDGSIDLAKNQEESDRGAGDDGEEQLIVLHSDGGIAVLLQSSDCVKDCDIYVL